MEGDAGTSRLNPTDENDTAADEAAEVSTADSTEKLAERESTEEPNHGRFGQGWLVTICLVLFLAAAALSAGGYLLLRSNAQGEQIARDDAVALQAAKDCVTATQAPDTASMGAAQARIVDCATGDFGAQAVFYSSMMLEAYQAANVQVEVADMRAAVERHHDDGSVDVLVAVRTKVTNSETADQEQGYRLRVTMQRADGTYKIANLVQVTT
jgi:Mce-associated membrane protein